MTTQEIVLQSNACGTHADECGGRSAHQAVAEEAVLASDQDFARKLFTEQTSNGLISHHAIQSSELDCCDFRQRHDAPEKVNGVGNTTGGFVQIKSNLRHPKGSEPFVVHDDHVLGFSEKRGGINQESVGTTLERGFGHNHRGIEIRGSLVEVGSNTSHTSDNDLIRAQAHSPASQDGGSLLAAEAQPASGVRPDGDSGDGLSSHVGHIALLSRHVDLPIGTEWDGYRGNQTTVNPCPKSCRIHARNSSQRKRYWAIFSSSTTYPIPGPSGRRIEPCAANAICGEIISSTYHRADASISVGNVKFERVAKCNPCADAIPSSGMVPIQQGIPADCARSWARREAKRPPIRCTFIFRMRALPRRMISSIAAALSADSSKHNGVRSSRCSSACSAMASRANGCSIIINWKRSSSRKTEI